LRKLLGEAATAEDVLQDVWLDVFRGLPRLTESGAFTAWLYRIARDRAYRVLRRRRRTYQALDGCEPAMAPADDTAFSAEDAARVHAALDRLAAEHREVLVLRFLEDLTYDEVARVLGCPVGTVRSRLHYAKQALAAVLERENHHERQRSG
jgi:RNA polymerase sigma-70 factor (ECF subfamily)